MKKAFLNLFTAEGRRHEVPTSKSKSYLTNRDSYAKYAVELPKTRKFKYNSKGSALDSYHVIMIRIFYVTPSQNCLSWCMVSCHEPWT